MTVDDRRRKTALEVLSSHRVSFDKDDDTDTLADLALMVIEACTVHVSCRRARLPIDPDTYLSDGSLRPNPERAP